MGRRRGNFCTRGVGLVSEGTDEKAKANERERERVKKLWESE